MIRGGGVGGISIVWGVWVARAVPPRTCAHGGSVGALDTPKLCPVRLKTARAPSEQPWDVGTQIRSDRFKPPQPPRLHVELRDKRSGQIEAVGALNTNKYSPAGGK